MGHRIELAEIEFVANNCDDIGLACAVFDGVESKIILYYVGASKAAVRSYLKANLPRYMLPQSIFQLDELPRTSGGKLDRVGLLEVYREQKSL
jgi:acyl-CoA synthetase (AMP-forming)/AMP-acid ligase II